MAYAELIVEEVYKEIFNSPPLVREGGGMSRFGYGAGYFVRVPPFRLDWKAQP